MNKLERLTINPRVMSGRPCIRGMRVTVVNILRGLMVRRSSLFMLCSH